MENSGSVYAAFRTDQGRVRSTNQDFVAWQEPANEQDERRDGWLYILADGAGGMDAGEIASRFATERTLHHYLQQDEERDWRERLRNAMRAANDDLRELCREGNGNARMATTMVATIIVEEHAYIANVGDSRAYLWRRGKLEQITRDQSLVAKLLEEGAITAEEAAHHPRKNVILSSLGSERDPRIDLYQFHLQPDDRLLLCSDGLTRHVEDEELTEVLEYQPAEEATETLVNLANERGGQDNISVGILHYYPSHTAAAAARAGRWLWAYTFLLSLVQTVLLFSIWLALRV
ncbi:MAG: Stp1/IreP family PP2C-type Ser/Thr phosphatase [Candidatus Promineifilaceae bacterium]|nr:Stp1/IreP family PP2C-type Ser/Thr phosphatase [Candidatus Promineifilaceae bacterium]